MIISGRKRVKVGDHRSRCRRLAEAVRELLKKIGAIEYMRGGNLYLLLADVVIVVHFLFIAFVVAGGLLVCRWPKVAFLHLPAALWGAAIEFMGRICPLTPLENQLRGLGGGNTYGGDFIVQYLAPVIYPSGLTAVTQYILGGMVVVINLAVYGFILRRHYFRKANFNNQ